MPFFRNWAHHGRVDNSVRCIEFVGNLNKKLPHSLRGLDET